MTACRFYYFEVVDLSRDTSPPGYHTVRHKRMCEVLSWDLDGDFSEPLPRRAGLDVSHVLDDEVGARLVELRRRVGALNTYANPNAN